MLAYLDPGAGSLLLQVLAGGLAGLAVVGKLPSFRRGSQESSKRGRSTRTLSLQWP